METIALVLVAVAALSAAGANLVLALCFLPKREKKQEDPAKTMEELETERKQLEQQRLELEGIANQMAFSGFAWRDGKKK